MVVSSSKREGSSKTDADAKLKVSYLIVYAFGCRSCLKGTRSVHAVTECAFQGTTWSRSL